MRKILLILILFFLNWTAFSQDNYIESVKIRNRIVGLTYAVFTSNQILEVGALGKRRVDGDALVKTTDRFHIGSKYKGDNIFFSRQAGRKQKNQMEHKIL